MKDHYQTLGVGRTATADEIKKAYRRLASQHHPDKGGDTAKFQEIEEAYRTLSDDQTRSQYDNPAPGGFHQSGSQFDFNTIFDMFGTRFQQPQPARHARMTLWITLGDVARGGNKTVSIGTNTGVNAVEIEIPPGIDDGGTVQYSRLAPGGADLLVTFRIRPDAQWTRNGPNLIMDHKVSIWDLITGGESTITDILGNQLVMGIPPHTQPGTQLRLRNRGLAQRQGPPGDLFVRMQAQIPDHIPQNIIDAIVQNQNK